MSKRKTNEEFIIEMKNMHPNIKILEKYINAHTKIKCECLIDGCIWSATPNNLLSQKGCPICGNKRISNKYRKTHQQFLSEMSNINSDIIILSKYLGDRDKVECKCVKCKSVWMATPSNLLQGSGCPMCKMSKGEATITKFLDTYNIKYIFQHTFKNCKYKQNLFFDFYLPDYNMCIEYDGIQHFKPTDFTGNNVNKANKNFNVIQIRDNIKNKYCQENNIKLLRIPYWEFNNIEKILNTYLIKCF